VQRFTSLAARGARPAHSGDQTRWGRFNELAERNRDALHQILEQARDAQRSRSPSEAKVGDYYAACMDEAVIEALGTRPLQPILSSVEAVASRGELFRLLGEHEAKGLPVPFRFGSRLTCTTQADHREPGPGRAVRLIATTT
jgi:predicted metalloendopeptidase